MGVDIEFDFGYLEFFYGIYFKNIWKGKVFFIFCYLSYKEDVNLRLLVVVLLILKRV